jgi:hypothetical protein
MAPPASSTATPLARIQKPKKGPTDPTTLAGKAQIFFNAISEIEKGGQDLVEKVVNDLENLKFGEVFSLLRTIRDLKPFDFPSLEEAVMENLRNQIKKAFYLKLPDPGDDFPITSLELAEVSGADLKKYAALVIEGDELLSDLIQDRLQTGTNINLTQKCRVYFKDNQAIIYEDQFDALVEWVENRNSPVPMMGGVETISESQDETPEETAKREREEIKARQEWIRKEAERDRFTAMYRAQLRKTIAALQGGDIYQFADEEDAEDDEEAEEDEGDENFQVFIEGHDSGVVEPVLQTYSGKRSRQAEPKKPSLASGLKSLFGGQEVTLSDTATGISRERLRQSQGGAPAKPSKRTPFKAERDEQALSTLELLQRAEEITLEKMGIKKDSNPVPSPAPEEASPTFQPVEESSRQLGARIRAGRLTRIENWSKAVSSFYETLESPEQGLEAMGRVLAQVIEKIPNLETRPLLVKFIQAHWVPMFLKGVLGAPSLWLDINPAEISVRDKHIVVQIQAQEQGEDILRQLKEALGMPGELSKSLELTLSPDNLKALPELVCGVIKSPVRESASRIIS